MLEKRGKQFHILLLQINVYKLHSFQKLSNNEVGIANELLFEIDLQYSHYETVNVRSITAINLLLQLQNIAINLKQFHVRHR